MGEALAVCAAVGCGVEVWDGWSVLCSDEHDKRGNANVIVNRKILVFKINRLLIKLLLADGILQYS